MLRAGLRRVTDRWAIALTATGSIGSIALNVAGVSGTGQRAPCHCSTTWSPLFPRPPRCWPSAS